MSANKFTIHNVLRSDINNNVSNSYDLRISPLVALGSPLVYMFMLIRGQVLVVRIQTPVINRTPDSYAFPLDNIGLNHVHVKQLYSRLLLSHTIVTGSGSHPAGKKRCLEYGLCELMFPTQQHEEF